MRLNERCSVCGSSVWCGRPCAASKDTQVTDPVTPVTKTVTRPKYVTPSVTHVTENVTHTVEALRAQVATLEAENAKLRAGHKQAMTAAERQRRCRARRQKVNVQ